MVKKIISIIALLLAVAVCYGQGPINKGIRTTKVRTDSLIIYKLQGALSDTLLCIKNDTVYWVLTSDIVNADTAQIAIMSGTLTIEVDSSMVLPKQSLMVLASGDITVTAPQIDTSDNGLTITVKNVGSYLDQVHFHIDSTTADSINDAYLTRWITRTIVAHNGRWYTKEKSQRNDCVYEVSYSGSFQTVSEVLGYLGEHMMGESVVRMGGGVYEMDHTEVIDLPYNLTFRGFSFQTTQIIADTGLTGKPMFRCLSNVTFENIRVDGSTLPNYGNLAGEDFAHYIGSGTYNEIRNVSLNRFNIGVLDSTDAELWMTEIDISNCVTAGLKVHSAVDSTKVRMQGVGFIHNDKGIWFSKGNKAYVLVDGTTEFRNLNVADSAIVYVPATFTSTANAFIQGVAWNNVGVFISGYDFTRSDGRDAIWYMENNAGIEDKNPHAKLNVLNNADTVNAVTAGQFYKAKWTNTSVYNCKWTMGNNRVTYQPANKRDATGVISCNIISSGNNKNIDIAIIKNGSLTTKYGQMTVRCSTAGQPYPITTSFYVPDMVAGDYLELWVSCATASEIIIVQDVSWLLDTK